MSHEKPLLKRLFLACDGVVYWDSSQFDWLSNKDYLPWSASPIHSGGMSFTLAEWKWTRSRSVFTFASVPPTHQRTLSTKPALSRWNLSRSFNSLSHSSKVFLKSPVRSEISNPRPWAEPRHRGPRDCSSRILFSRVRFWRSDWISLPNWRYWTSSSRNLNVSSGRHHHSMTDINTWTNLHHEL